MPDPLVHIEQIADQIVEYCKALVRIPTVNPPGDHYEDLCQYLLTTLQGLNCQVELVRVPSSRAEELYPWGKDYPRVSVIGRYLGSRSQRAGLHLSGHFDVVPPGKGWTKDPFQPVLEDGKLYGLGISDMKGGIASILGVIQTLADLRIELSGDLTFSFTPDEETGGHGGVGYLAEQRLIQADYGIITEPSQPHLVKIGHRGVLWVEFVTRGKTAHGSVPYKGINAFEKMVKIALGLQELEKRLHKKQTAFPVIEPEQRHPSLMIGGVVRGGVKTNVVPDECFLSIDRRLIPEETVQEAYAEIQEVIARLQNEDPELRVDLSTPLRIEPAHVPIDHLLCTTVATSHEEIYGKSPQRVISPGFADSHYLVRNLGIPTITYGPGTISMAHAPDEYIIPDDLVKATQVLTRVALQLLA
ncbi:MAG: ArgE/DapE family deacylase [Nitrospinota bacterium]|nr:MAG: ArgE/DapE family deacylase [Nitrospinota bacterium]